MSSISAILNSKAFAKPSGKVQVSNLDLATISFVRSSVIANLSGSASEQRTQLTGYLAEALTEKRKVWLPEGSYNFDREVIIPSKSILQMHPDAVLNFPNTHVGAGIMSAYTSGLIIAGSYGTEVALTANLLEGNQALTVGSASGFAVGDLVKIGSNKEFRDNTPKAGELQYIGAISGTTITLRGDARDSYLVSDGAFIQKLTPAKNVILEGGNIKSTAVDGAGGYHSGVRAETVVNVEINGLVVMGWRDTGIEICDTLGAMVDSCKGFDVGWRPATSDFHNTGYFVLASQATEGMVSQGHYTERCRKGADCSGFSSTHGVSRDIKFLNSHFKDCGSGGVGAHASSQGILFDGVTANSTEAANLRGTDITLNDCDLKFEDATLGLAFRTEGKAGYCHINNTKIRNKGTGAFQVAGSSSPSDTADFLDIKISNSSFECVDGNPLLFRARINSDILGLQLHNVTAKTQGAFAALFVESADGESVRSGAVIGGLYDAPNSTNGAIEITAASSTKVELLVQGVTANGGAYGITGNGASGDLDRVIAPVASNRFYGTTAARNGLA